jgi:hypothetical protein
VETVVEIRQPSFVGSTNLKSLDRATLQLVSIPSSVHQPTISIHSIKMTASPIRPPLVTHNRRRVAPHPLQEKQMVKPQFSILMARSESLMDKNDKVDFSTTVCAFKDFELEGIFRRQWIAETEELDDMWTLKRASPIFDEDEQPYESPSKRSRTTQLYWKDRLSEEEPFLLSTESLLLEYSE